MKPWWEKPLEDLNDKEWEDLCDLCGQCCLNKLLDQDTHEVAYTRVVCDHINLKTCQCSVYPDRRDYRPDCIPVTIETVMTPGMMPTSCSYQLRLEGLPLPDWHPLITGDPLSAQKAGMGVDQIGVFQNQIDMDEIQDFIIDPPIN